MRPTIPTAILLSALLAACSSSGDVLTSKNFSQTGPLKVHPGLIGEQSKPAVQPGTPVPPATPEAGSPGETTSR